MPETAHAAQVLAAATAVRERARAVVLVEGPSDRAAVEALARLRDVDLDAAGIAVVELGGATNIGAWLAALGRPGPSVTVAGLYDVAEERYYRRALERLRWAQDADRATLVAHGFHACDEDLEDELLRANGFRTALDVLAVNGDLASFRTLQRQPAHLGGDEVRQLRRFLGAGAHRKTRYARLLVESLDGRRAPDPLVRVLERVSGG